MARAWRSTILPVSWLWTSMVFSSRWWGWFHNTILEEDHVGLSCYGSYTYVRAYGVAPPPPAPRDLPGDRLSAPGPGRGPPPADQGAGAARRTESESAVAAARPACGGLRVAGAHLRLVHGGL